MGYFTYDGAIVQFDDRTLAHLQIVIVQQFRRNESFVMSWLDALSVGDGRSSIWLHPTSDIYFKFEGSRFPAINQEWLDALTTSARSSQGLVVRREDGQIARSQGANRRT